MISKKSLVNYVKKEVFLNYEICQEGKFPFKFENLLF